MATEPLPSPAVCQDRMNQWLQAQAAPGPPVLDTKVEFDPDPDIDAETVILRPAWPRIFPPL